MLVLRSRFSPAPRQGVVETFAVALLFTAVVIAEFHTVAWHLTHVVAGKAESDTTQAWWSYWAIAQTGHTPWTASHIMAAGAPEGLPQPIPVEILSPFQPAFVWLFKPLLGLLGALNLFMLSGFVATGTVMFAFLRRRLTLTAFASLFGAFVTAFNPWMIERALVGQIGFLHAWPLIALIWCLLPRDARSDATGSPDGARRPLRAVAAGAFFGLSVWVSAYYGLLAVVVIGAWLLNDALFRRPRLSDARRLLPVGGLIAFIFLAPGLIAYLLDPGTVQQTYSNARVQIDGLSAKAWAYFIPSWRQTWWRPRIWSPIEGTQAVENTLYFGYTTLSLALIAAIYFVAARVRGGRRVPSEGLFFLTLLLVAFLTSLPPDQRLAGLPIALSRVVVAVTPYFRVFARVGFLCGVALSALASLALSVGERALRARRSYRRARVIPLLALALVTGELLVWPTPASVPGSLSAADRWLLNEPRGIVAFYPLASPQGTSYDFWGREYQAEVRVRDPLFDTLGVNLEGTAEQLLRYASRDLSQPQTAGILASEHVKYVVVDQAAFAQAGVPLPPSTPGFRQVAALPGYAILTPTAPPIDGREYLAAHAAQVANSLGWVPPDVTLTGGFNGPESRGRWMKEIGELRVDNSSDYTTLFRIRGRAFSVVQPRLLEVRQGRRLLASVRINTFDAPFTTAPFRIPAGKVAVTLTTKPGAIPLPGDGRIGSIYLEELTLQPLVDLRRKPAA